MKWEEHLKHQLQADGGPQSYEQLYRICMLAYTEGHNENKTKTIEAYRLRCGRLFGNRCMPTAGSRSDSKRICDANCTYIKKYEFELNKLSGCVETPPE